MFADPIAIVPFEPGLRSQVIAVWEKSVRATHHFLSAEDIDFYKALVSGIDFNSFLVYCLLEGGVVRGFLGLADGKVEMLFLDPEVIGKGLGRRLLLLAVDELDATAVDVNEQNTQAVRFYERFGFRTMARTEQDDAGKPYPILKMQLAAVTS